MAHRPYAKVTIIVETPDSVETTVFPVTQDNIIMTQLRPYSLKSPYLSQTQIEKIIFEFKPLPTDDGEMFTFTEEPK